MINFMVLVWLLFEFYLIHLIFIYFDSFFFDGGFLAFDYLSIFYLVNSEYTRQASIWFDDCAESVDDENFLLHF